MRTRVRILSLLMVLASLLACTSQQVKSGGTWAALATASLAAEVFLGIEPPTPEERRADMEREHLEQRRHDKRVAALTAGYEEFVRTQGEPARDNPDPAPVVMDTRGELEWILEKAAPEH